MRWVDVGECLPDTADRVLVAMYVCTCREASNSCWPISWNILDC